MMRERRCKAHRSPIDLGDEMCAKAYAAYRRGAPYPPAYPCESVEVLVIQADHAQVIGQPDDSSKLIVIETDRVTEASANLVWSAIDAGRSELWKQTGLSHMTGRERVLVVAEEQETEQ